jgi:HD-GYP domain-containing protein (c-di-GMP phosphodiesterase class II)
MPGQGKSGVRRAGPALAVASFTPRIIAVLLIILFIFLGWTFFWLLYAERQSLLEARRQAISDEMSTALSTAWYFQGQAKNGELSDIEARTQALAVISNLRFGEMNVGYFYVLNTSGVLLAHSLRPDLVNRSVMRLEDADRRQFIAQLLQSAQQNKRGFLSYRWQWVGSTQHPGLHLACYAWVEGWDWVLVTDASVTDINARISLELVKQLQLLALLSVILALVLSSTLRRLVLSGVDRLITLAAKLRAGDFSARAFATGADELSPLAKAFNAMAEGMQQRDVQLRQAQRASVFALAKLAEARDNETGEHLLRVREYAVLLAGALKQQPRYEAVVTETFLSDLYDATMLHDIGKVGIPDHILLKPDVLDEGEMAIMMSHTLIGANTIRAARQQMHVEGGFLVMAEQIARSHHERWDGHGYVEQLQGNSIPPAARIFTVADIYDALTTSRPYKPAFSHEHAVQLMSEERNRRFDPDVFDAFLRVSDEFDTIRRRYAGNGGR